jgi:cell division protein FtsB
MFEELKEEITVNKLSEKVNDLLVRFEEMKSQNSTLRQEVVTLKAQNEAKNVQIEKLEEDLMNKDIESDDIFSKIEEVLKR